MLRLAALSALCCFGCTGLISEDPQHAPTVSVDAPQVVRLPRASVTAHASAADADGDALQLRWTARPEGLATLSGSDTDTVTLTALAPGVLTLEVTATDPSQRAATASTTVTVLAAAEPNQPPTVSAGADVNVTLPSGPVTLHGQASDADGSISALSWTQQSGAALTLSDTTTTDLTVTGLVEGTFVFRLTATDDLGATGFSEVQVNVTSTANQPPAVQLDAVADVQLPLDTATVRATASDPDGQIASWAWTLLAGDATTGPLDQPTLSLSMLKAGPIHVRVRVTDDRGATASDELTFQVLAANAAPTVDAGSDVTLTLPVDQTTLTAAATDSDGTIVSWAWSQLSGPPATLSGAPTASLNVTGLGAGTSRFRCTVTDDDGATASDDVTVVVMVPSGTEVNTVLGKPTVGYRNRDETAYPPSAAVDGSASTFWSSDYPLLPGHFLSIDLQGAYDVTRFEIETGFSSSATPTNAWELQSWNGCWQTIPGSEVTGNTQHLRTGTFTAPVRTTRLRFFCRSETAFCQVRELRVFGVASSSPAPTMTCPQGAQTVVRHPGHDYALFLPQGYDADPARRWPLVISLHGLGGHSLTVDRTGIASPQEGMAQQLSSAAFASTFGAILISPNAKAPYSDSGTGYFNVPSVLALTDQAISDLLVDPDRVSLTGISGGSNVSWGAMADDADRWAAFVPVATTSTPTNLPNLCNLKAVPIWGFQGANDNPPQITATKAALDACPPSSTPSAMQTTIIPNAGHSAATWDTAYATPALYPWLFAQQRSARP